MLLIVNGQQSLFGSHNETWKLIILRRKIVFLCLLIFSKDGIVKRREFKAADIGMKLVLN